MLDRSRLASILGMLGSNHPGERDNADRLVKDAGVTWHEVVVDLDSAIVEAVDRIVAGNEEQRAEIERVRKEVRPRPPQPWAGCEGWQDGVEALLLWAEHLSTWERDFLNSLLLRCRRLSPKQQRVLARIGERVGRLIRSSWAASP
jgi:hypothetical protein